MTAQPHLNSIKAGIESAKEIPEQVAALPGSSDARVPDTSVPNTGVSDTGVSGTPVPDWRDGLPDELKNAPSLAKFKDKASLAKSYLEAEKAFSSRIVIPKDDATEGEWDAFYKKIGRPEDKRYRPDDMPISEEEGPILARYEEILHASGLTKRQGQKVLTHMAELSAQMDAEARTREETVRAGNLKILEEAFGDQMEVRINQIQAALGQFGGKELAVLVEQTNYHPALVQFLGKVGEKLASDRLVMGDPPRLVTSKQAALEEIKRLETDEAFQVSYRGNDFEKRQEAINQMHGLHKIAYQQTME